MTYLLDADFFIYYEKFPSKIWGAVSPNCDGTFSIFLNSRATDAQQFIGYIHEVEHIRNDDFYNDNPIEIVEAL